jgi:hypothetical protein
MTFLLGLWANPVARRIIVYGAIALGVMYAGRLWLNKHDSRIEQEARIKVTQELGKSKEAEWKAKEAAIARAATDLSTQKASVVAATEQLARDRADLSRTLNATLAQIQRERNRQYANAAATPDSAIWDSIRTVSSQLAAHP